MVSEKKPATHYKELLVWQKAFALATDVYLLSAKFPAEERYGLVSQMRRAAISVPSNIAEGQARRTTGEFIQFVSNAEGSAAELETQLLLSVEFGYCVPSKAQPVLATLTEVRKMLGSLRRKLVARC